jgi:DNA replication and repair protein RecF
MMLSDLTLTNFRSYSREVFTFAPTTTLLIGPNTAGKTNILEAIMVIATGKSFRADIDAEMVRWGAQVGRAKATDGETTLEVVLTTGAVGGRKTQSKKFLVNGIVRRQLDFVGQLRAVLFWPEHLELITDSPSLRRKYLDGVLVQVDREYRRNLLSYERGLRQRNRLLDLIGEGKAHHHQLQFWDQLLIRAGGYLTDTRAAFIDFINTYQIRGVTYRVGYDKSVISQSRLAQYAQEEVAAKSTLVGPHRDDFFVTKNELDVSKYGSRGEQRLAILWLKLAELEFITVRSREAGSGSARPLLILDDIFSEFDVAHRELVLDLLDKQQTIVSSADEEVLDLFKKHRIPAKIIRLGA